MSIPSADARTSSASAPAGAIRLAPGGGPFPSPFPAPGQSGAAWHAAIDLARHRHDTVALDAALRAQEELGETFGEDPLGLASVPVSISWAEVPVEPDGEGIVGLRIYAPQQQSGDGAPAHRALPVVAFVHGGGYWMGGGVAGRRINEPLCRAIAQGAGAIVVDIDHRLAPEHRWPVPVDDVCAVIRWICQNAAELGADPERIALHGVSSGGNLVAVASHRALDGALPPIAAVVLQVASLNLSFASNRFRAPAEEVAGARQLVALYAGDADPADPAISPGLREDLSGLPPTLLITADDDPLTADALKYADRLEEAGVPVARRPYPMTHTVAAPEVLRRQYAETVAWLRETLA